jgi:hypothetical protein
MAFINDAIENIWPSIVVLAFQTLLKGPINLTFAPSTERVSVVSIPDPTFNAQTLMNFVSGSPVDPLRTIWFTVTYVTESGSETLPAIVFGVVPGAATLLRIASPAFAAGAIGWNAYAGNGVSPQTRLAKQNDEPIPFGSSWTEPDAGASQDPDDPLPPTENTTGDDISAIRLLEVLLPDSTRKVYSQADLNSTLMRRFSRSVATSSPFNTYAFDFLNMHTIEIRPMTGAQLDTRYFYIKQPRKIRFTNAPIPFQHPGAWAFLKYRACGLFDLSNKEFPSAEAWFRLAEQERMQLMIGLTSLWHDKDLTVASFMR